MPEPNIEATQPDGNEATKRRITTIVFVIALLVLEAAALAGVIFALGGPDPVQAVAVLPQTEDEGRKIVEILVLDDRLPNNRQGINYVFDTEIWVHVRKKHETRVSDELNRFRNEVKAECVAIWRIAEPRHLQEPRMETLTRKVRAFLSQRFGDDPETGEPIIEKCVIVSGPGFRVDG